MDQYATMSTLRYVVMLAAALLFSTGTFAAEFDPSALRARGIDPQVLKYLDKEPSFPAGYSLVNISNWLFRTHQILQKNQFGLTSQVTDSYVQRFIPNLNKVLQGGIINVNNSLFALDTITGVQLTPEDALNNNNGSGVSVKGIANTPQARVEVRQFGALIYTTLVPAGPFTLLNIPLKSLNADLNVTVIENDSQRHSFVVAAQSLVGNTLAASSGFSLALGKIRDNAPDTEAPQLLAISDGWQVTPGLSVQAGVLAATKYQSLAFGIDSTPWRSMLLSANLLASKESYSHTQGDQLNLSASYSTTNNLSLNVSFSQNSRHFTSLGQATSNNKRNGDNNGNSSSSNNSSSNSQNQKNQATLSLSWPLWNLGSFSFSHSESTSYSSARTYSYNMLSWSKSVSNITFSINGSQGGDGETHDRQLYINLNFPWGGSHINNYYRTSNNSALVGSQLSNKINDEINYSLSTERNTITENTSLQGGVNTNLHYTTVNANVSGNNDKTRNYNWGTRGGIALHKGGVTFSPNAIGDTFGIIKLNEPLAGVVVNTPSGKVWTDWKGQAVASVLPSYSKSALDLNTESLPKNIDANNGHRDITPARGTVATIRYNVLTNNRLLLTILLANGNLLPKGSVVFDQQKNFLASVVDDGMVFLSNAPKKATFYVQLVGTDTLCKLSYAYQHEAQDNVLYESITTKCL